MHLDTYDYHYRRAASYDYNRSGFVSQEELPRTSAATRVLDKNWDNRVSVWELADGFRRGDVKITGGELRAWYESGYRPYDPPYRPRPYYRRSDEIVGNTIVGGLLGAAAGALIGGRDGAAAGAVIGGTLGAVSSIDD